MRAAVLLLALIASSAASDFYLCEVVVPNFCATLIDEKKDGSCMSDPSLTLQGESYPITTSFNVIAFGSLNAAADTEGRVLVQGNGVLATGYSIGALIYTDGPGAVDSFLPYSAIFGGNLNWPTGYLSPDGTYYYAAAAKEDMYVGGTFTGAQDLRDRLTTNTESSFTQSFDNAQSFYTQVQTAFDQTADNSQYTVTDSHTMVITCPADASAYYIHIPSSAFSGVSSYGFTGCSSSVQLVITIPADSQTVSFTSGAISPDDRQASRTVFNIMGSGRTIKFTSTRFYGIILAPNNDYTVDANAPGATDGIVIVNNVVSAGQFNRINCTVPTVPAQVSPCVSFETACTGTLFSAPGSSIQGDTRDYNVISFGDFVANTGDIEGRLMVRNDATFGNGYSIGYMLQTANNLVDRQEAYALLAGGDCVWGQGAIFPDGTNYPYAGNEEDIFCGRSFSGPADLTARNAGGCSTEGCLDSVFDAAYTCYSGYSTTASTQSTNVAVTVFESNMIFTCSDSSADEYYVNVDSTMFTQATYYTTSGCNYQAYWFINVVGTGDVLLTGGSFPAVPGAVVYNIIGERTITVTGTAVNGHILAPDATLDQTGGVILGKVVVGNVIASLQINKEDRCHTVTDVPVPVQNGPNDCEVGATQCCITTNPPVMTGITLISVSFDADTTVVGPAADTTCPDAPTGTTPTPTPNPNPSSGDTPTPNPSSGTNPNTPSDNTPSDQLPISLIMSNPVTAKIPANSKIGTINVPSNAGGKAATVGQTSSASVAIFSVAVLAVALLF